VFCTAYEAYAVRAFEVNALDYLVKPVSPEQVERALERLKGPAEAPASTELKMDDLVALEEARTLRFVSAHDITFIQAADDYSEVHVAGGTPALVDVPLRRWEERLPRDFVRVHRSTLVNVRHVESVQHVEGRWEVSLRGGPRLPVSRRLGAEVLERLKAGAPHG
jgi:two-component system, LytTR family, response regulator